MKKCNGWSSRDTWLANLWLQNVEPMCGWYFKAKSVQEVKRLLNMLLQIPMVDEIHVENVNFEELFEHCEVNE